MSDEQRGLGIVCALAGALCFSVSGTLQALAPEGVTPFVVAATRAMVGSLFLWMWCRATGKLPKKLPPGFFAQAARCAVWISIAQVFFFWGIFEIGVATATTIDIAMTPIGAALIAWYGAGKRPGTAWLLSTILALCGVGCIGGGLRTDVSMVWLALPILGGFAYAGYLAANKSLSDEVAPEACVMVILAIVSVLLCPVYWFFPVDWVVGSLRGIAVVVGIGVVTAGLAFPLVLAGVRHLSVPVAATLGLAEPLGAALLGFFVLGEDAGTMTLAGIGMLFVALVGLIWSETRTGHASHEP